MLLMIFPTATTRNSYPVTASSTASVCPGLAAGTRLPYPTVVIVTKLKNRSWLSEPSPAEPTPRPKARRQVVPEGFTPSLGGRGNTTRLGFRSSYRRPHRLAARAWAPRSSHLRITSRQATFRRRTGWTTVWSHRRGWPSEMRRAARSSLRPAAPRALRPSLTARRLTPRYQPPLPPVRAARLLACGMRHQVTDRLRHRQANPPMTHGPIPAAVSSPLPTTRGQPRTAVTMSPRRVRYQARSQAPRRSCHGPTLLTLSRRDRWPRSPRRSQP